jgi:hypothetical protein
MHIVYASKNYEDTLKNNFENKVKHIRPSPEFLENYPDIINFLFSIQDLYANNPATYQEIVQSIKSFITVYEESMKIPKLSHENYSIAEIKLNNAVNCMNAMIITSIPKNNMNNKINKACSELYKILIKYLNEIETNIKKDIMFNGYYVGTKTFDYKMKPYNYEESNLYNFNMVY